LGINYIPDLWDSEVTQSAFGRKVDFSVCPPDYFVEKEAMVITRLRMIPSIWMGIEIIGDRIAKGPALNNCHHTTQISCFRTLVSTVTD
jgi:hypothetical protein